MRSAREEHHHLDGGRIGNTGFLQIARHFGAMDVISKPFDPDELLALVKECLAKGLDRHARARRNHLPGAHRCGATAGLG